MIRLIYTLLMSALAVFVCYSMTTHDWLQTDLTELLPKSSQDAVLQAAERAGDAQINSQIILLAGSPRPETAFQTASEIASLWRQSGLFSEVNSQISPDLAQIRQDIGRISLAVLPEAQRRLLTEKPADYFRQRAEDAANPFAVSPLPLDEDWLGFGRFVTGKINPQTRLQWHPENGMLFNEDNGKTWVWIRAKLPDNALPQDALGHLFQKTQTLASDRHTEILTGGGALFAAAAKADAEKESRIMGFAGITLTVTLILWVFRSARTFWLLLPSAAGMLAGLAATLAVFGHIHALTLVIGTSLIGMLVDFPLHWLTPSVFSPWQAKPAMRQVLPTFAVSLLITVSGYALLWFTPLPVLQQTAVFSGFSLLGAFGATVCLLPPLFARYQAKPVPFAALSTILGRHIKKRLPSSFRYPAAVFLMVFAAVGLWRSNWHDDIRQWVNMPPGLLSQIQKIGTLGGTDFSGQYLVAEAASEDALLLKNAELRRALAPLIQQGKLKGIQSLDQFILPAAEQNRLKQYLRAIADKPGNYRALHELGIPEDTLKSALLQAADTPALTLSDGIALPLAQAWKPLYLGEVEPHRYASVIRLNGMTDPETVRKTAETVPGIKWADKRGRLNELFRHTRNQAAWLKLSSYLLAWLLLWRLFGARQGGKILAVPIAAAIGTVAVLGWLGIPVSLFAMFGLLLVSAIGIDYAVYALNAGHSTDARLGGMLLAALTTGISFAILTFSGTPAVAAFGMTVGIGVILNLWLAARLMYSVPDTQHPNRQPPCHRFRFRRHF